MASLRVSVVIPAYNRADTICRAVHSALIQTYPVYEVIVVDDCSTDNTVEMVESIDDRRICVIRNAVNSGACASRNIGIGASTGGYIALLDSDDEWLPNKLEKQIKALEASGADVCTCRFRRIFTEASYVIDDSRDVLPSSPAGMLSRRSLVKESLVSTQTILAKREVFDVYSFDDAMPRLQDYEWVIRASSRYSFYLVDDTLVNVYLQDDSITATGCRKVNQAFELILSKHRNSMADEPILLSFLFRSLGHSRANTGLSPASCYKASLKLHFDIKVLVNLLLAKIDIFR